jgi:hypothetical protein
MKPMLHGDIPSPGPSNNWKKLIIPNENADDCTKARQHFPLQFTFHRFAKNIT